MVFRVSADWCTASRIIDKNSERSSETGTILRAWFLPVTTLGGASAPPRSGFVSHPPSRRTTPCPFGPAVHVLTVVRTCLKT